MEALKPKQIVLLGIGHTHAHLVREWKQEPLPNAKLICVSDSSNAAYSGMLPGTLAGQYRPEQMLIDLPSFCRSANVELIVDAARSVDPAQKTVTTTSGQTLAYDLLSIGIGSKPIIQIPGADHPGFIPIKPMQTFLDRLSFRLAAIQSRDSPSITVVGGGLGGIEIAFCLERRLRRSGEPAFSIALIQRDEQIAAGLKTSTRKRIHQNLEQRGIEVLTSVAATAIEDDRLILSNGTSRSGDVVIWAAHAIAPEWVSGLPLEHDERGFLLTRPTLQTRDHDDIFVVGDTGTIAENPHPKAGVFAVRQGPVLWENIRRQLEGKPLEEFHPQREFLKLINLGSGEAIGEYRGWSFEGRWVWWMKDFIDRRFISQYQ